jgi:pimeloyl-ACP methyl ester carboxylesterase
MVGSVSSDQPLVEHRLRAADGVEISAVHLTGAHDDLCFVVVHGFTGNWREERVQKVLQRLEAFGSIVAIDMRGHGRSTGVTTLGDLEVLDVAAAVAWARELGYSTVVTVGFSLGGAVVLREGGLAAAGDLPAGDLSPGDLPAGDLPSGELPEGEVNGQVDAVVAVSAPAFWYYKGTKVTRFVHRLVETRWGRAIMRAGGTRVTDQAWVEPYPVPPFEAAALLDVPLLVVHGDVDRYFPIEHPLVIQRSAMAAGVRSDLWLEQGFGHAENAVSPELLDRIGRWARECTAPGRTAREVTAPGRTAREATAREVTAREFTTGDEG